LRETKESSSTERAEVVESQKSPWRQRFLAINAFFLTIRHSNLSYWRVDSKRSLKNRLIELDASGFPNRVKAALLEKINAQVASALEEIVRQVVTPHSLAALYATGDIAKPIKQRKVRKQVIQEGGSPFGQHVTGAEPVTVTGSESTV
jgi:hypothetical protein